MDDDNNESWLFGEEGRSLASWKYRVIVAAQKTGNRVQTYDVVSA